jgi:hypothetical protein
MEFMSENQNTKARLVPLYFESAQDADFVHQVNNLKQLLAAEAEILEPVALGAVLPEADAVVFPQMLGAAYRRAAQIKAIPLPILVITSEFGTVSMWDWEINRYLHAAGVEVIAPYNLAQAKIICKALALKRELAQTRFLVYQDNPGEGFQASIFKRFYWWEEECTRRIKERFGVEIVRKSFKELGAAAQQIPDAEAEKVWQEWQPRLVIGDISQSALYSALKVYLAVKRDLDQDASIRAVGINCLNESHFSDSTPCLAWNMLYMENKLLWGCEADTVSMLTEYLVHHTLGVPVMMTNLYPFLMGQAALKHEGIPDFPPVEAQPQNHILAAHCGYLGVVPQPFAADWTLRKKVLAIVNDNATAIDARLPSGEITLVKIETTFDRLSVVEGVIEGYAGFPGSDCLNGAVIRVPDGHALLSQLASHHYILAQGSQRINLEWISRVFNLAD